MENPFETAVEVLPAATMTPAPKPAFEATLADILAAAQAQVEQSKKIIVTDPSDVDGIKQSKEYRLALKKLRCAGNDAHKDGKADILRAGRAIDGMKNIILQVCEPEEARLEGQEKIAERIAAERAAKLRAEREAVLVELGENPAFWGPFERFPVEDWAQRVEGVRAVIKAREEQAKRQAEEAARKAKEDAEERERMRAENARLKKEADEREAAMKAEREAAEAVLREERARAKAIEDAARAEAAKLAQERAKVEAEARAREEAEREAKRKAEAAPDREKFLALADFIESYAVPTCATNEGRNLAFEISERKRGFAQWVRRMAGEL